MGVLQEATLHFQEIMHASQLHMHNFLDDTDLSFEINAFCTPHTCYWNKLINEVGGFELWTFQRL